MRVPALLALLVAGFPPTALASPALAGCYRVEMAQWGGGGNKPPMEFSILPKGNGYVLTMAENGERHTFPVRSGTTAELAVLGLPSERPITEGFVIEFGAGKRERAEREGRESAPFPVLVRAYEKGQPLLLMVMPFSAGAAVPVPCR